MTIATPGADIADLIVALRQASHNSAYGQLMFEAADTLEATCKLLAEAGEAIAEASEAISESLRYIDGDPPHQHLPNLAWLAAVDRQTRSFLTRIKEHQ